MLYHLTISAPGRLELRASWYDAGDILRVGADERFIFEGAVKGLAKVWAELFALGAVEPLTGRRRPTPGKCSFLALTSAPGGTNGRTSAYIGVPKGNCGEATCPA